MTKMIRLALVLSLLLLVVGLLAGTGITAAQVEYPHFFYGSVKYYSTPGGPYTDAPVGTVVTAKVAGEVKGQITVTEVGMYGGEGPGDLKLLVQDSIPSGSVVTFYVDGKLVQEVRVQYDYPGGAWYDVDPEWEVTFTSGDVWGLDLIYFMPPTIANSPTSFSFSATEGGTNPPSRTLSIWNSSAYLGAMAWTVTDNATWLGLIPMSGTSSGEHDAVTVSVDISGLTADSYAATITITAVGATNTPRTVPVSLTIYQPTPTPQVTPVIEEELVIPTPSPPVVTPTPPGPVVPVLRSVEVTPEEASIEVGETQQFTATATYSGGSTVDVTADADWASSNTGVATIDDAGLATGVAAGTTGITATFEGTMSDPARLNVSVVLESIAVTPESAKIDVGDTQQFTVIATYTGGITEDVTAEADWASSNTGVATIDDAGLATGVAGGTAEITATFGGMTSAPASILTISGPPAIPWWIIGLIIGLLMLLALLLLLRRRMRRGEEAAA